MSYNPRLARLKRYAVTVFLLYCALYYLKVNVAARLPDITDSPCDFTHYYLVAHRVLAAQSPYTDPEHNYPPAVAFLLTPLALTDYMTARRTWFWSSQAFLLLGAFLTWRALGRDWVSACSVACVWALAGAAAENFVLGQLGPLLVLLLVLVYWRAAAAQGAAVAAGLSLKLLPGILSIVLLLRRDWRAVAVLELSINGVESVGDSFILRPSRVKLTHLLHQGFHLLFHGEKIAEHGHALRHHGAPGK